MSILGMTLILMFLLLFIGIPIGAGIGIAALFGIDMTPGLQTTVFAQRMFNLFDSFPLMAVPFFILAGDIMQRGTIANSLLDLCKTLVGHLRGGLGHIAIITSLFYGALCGSAVAAVAAVGAIIIPAMVNEGYPRPYATAIATAGGILGPLIPPSIALILVGSFGGIDVTKLFIGTIIPGCAVALGFLIVNAWTCRRHNYGIMHEKQPISAKLKAIWEAKWALGVPVLILGSIYGGIATPTEAGAIGVIYALFVETFITRSMSWKLLATSLESSLSTLGMIFFVILCANGFGVLIQLYNLENTIISFLQGIISSKISFLFILTLILLLLGTFLDGTVIIIVLAPLLVPIAKTYGIDPVHFGVYLSIAICIGSLTPPVGYNLYVGCSVGNVKIHELVASIIPFIISMIFVTFIVAYVPWLSLVFIQ